MLDRTVPPIIRPIEHFSIDHPEVRMMRNGMPLRIIRVGDEDVIRFDLLIHGGQCSAKEPVR